MLSIQPPSGGCVLKRYRCPNVVLSLRQPPSGGCVLKQRIIIKPLKQLGAAAFGRLCVETITRKKPNNFLRPAAFGRLCVETRLPDILVLRRRQPPSGGCVLKHIALFPFVIPPSQPPSGGCVLKHWQGWRISEIARPAAFGRLCVETALNLSNSARRASAAFGRLCVETV